MEKQKHIVRFHNDLNSLELQGYTESNINILMTLCHTMSEQGTNEITISLDTLKKILNPNQKGVNLTKKRIQLFAKEMQRVRLEVEQNNCTIYGVLFHKIKVDNEGKTITIKTDKEFVYIINNLVENYTIFDLQDLIGIKGVYNKLIFKLLKQFKETGIFMIDIQNFKRLLGVPESYKIPQITERILNPAIKELSPYFKNLKCEKIKKAGHGNVISHIKFKWLKEEKKVNLFAKINNEEILNRFEESQAENITYLQEVMPEYSRDNIIEYLQLADVPTIIYMYKQTLRQIKNNGGKYLNRGNYLKKSIINHLAKKKIENTNTEVKPKDKKENFTPKTEVKTVNAKPKEDDEMDELERRLQERLYRRLMERGDEVGA